MTVLHGDCLEVMPTLEASSFDAIVTDPPYHLTTGKKGGTGAASLNPNSPAGRSRIGTGFMGKAWDGGDVAFQVDTWEAAYRIVKPGAYLVAFGGTRTYHRLTVAIEDAGWEIRDCLSWLYGSGFPKSHNGAWGGTALKPAWEPIILARKPLNGTVAANHEHHGTGALNIDGCRIDGPKASGSGQPPLQYGGTNHRPFHDNAQPREFDTSKGRWPSNVVLDEEAAAALDEQTGTLHSGDAHVLRRGGSTGKGVGYGSSAAGNVLDATYGDSGGASRFFYTSKASRAEREAGLREAVVGSLQGGGQGANDPVSLRFTKRAANTHPTVKPLDLMQWLCRLITPRGGLILDPFCGSGTTGRAAVAEGFRFVGIEKEAEYVEIAKARIAEYAPLFGGAA